MATLPQVNEAPAEEAPPQAERPDGNDSSKMIGYIDPGLPPKVQTFLEAAKAGLLNAQGAVMLKKVLSQAGDHVKALAMLIEKTIQKLEDKLGPLEDQEHDQVAFFIAGWLVSSLQEMGMPGLDNAEGRQDLIGRVLQALDGMTKGDPNQPTPPAEPGTQGALPPPVAPSAPGGGGGTMPQLGGVQ